MRMSLRANFIRKKKQIMLLKYEQFEILNFIQIAVKMMEQSKSTCIHLNCSLRQIVCELLRLYNKSLAAAFRKWKT